MELNKLIEVSEEALSLLNKGAFLTTKDGDHENTMIISWGTFGQMWEKPVMMVMVRDSRYTYDLLENAGEFTVTFPKTEELKAAWKIAGTKSGRDMNKFQECGIKRKNAKSISTPILDTPGLQFECKVLYKTPMEDAGLPQAIRDDIYPKEDYHTLYYAEILEIYETV